MRASAPSSTDATRTVTVAAPAKVNLHLGVYPGRDARGYHRADSVMAAVALYDEVTVATAESPAPTVTCDPPIAAPSERTAAARAVTALADAIGRKPQVAISIRRAIPSRGGLGSASADAAAALLACCRLWGVPADAAAVRAAARAIGADVAFFLAPAPSLMVGVGDELAASYPDLHAPVALARPPAGVSTPAAFAAFDAAPSAPADPAAICAALASSDVAAVAAHLHNNLAAAAASVAPEVADVTATLRASAGVLGAQVTGSGSCSFAICESMAAARAAADAAAARGWWSCATTFAAVA